jgi:hypothetical protein
VVYAIVEIRKMLEHDAQIRQFETLAFFCDWAVHTRLNRYGARQIVTLLDDRLSHFDPAHPGTVDPDGLVHKILSFDLFREQLLEFLRRNDLPTMWAEDDFIWKKFVVLYGEVVRDVPLSMTREDYEFWYLRNVVIAASEPSEAIIKANPGQTFYGFKWTFVLDDGRSFTLPYTSNFPEPPVGWETLGRR